jgi:hypothetical protein
MPDVDVTEPIRGPYGEVVHVPMLDESADYDPKARAALATHRGTWLIDAPVYHPAWSQYVLHVISLADAPDVPPATLKFVGATHELLLVAIDPGPGRQTVETVQGHCLTGKLPFLTPVNIAEQFECTDDEIRQVAWLCARAVVQGFLNPETGDGPARVRESWLQACVKTLAHIRGEAHAS